MNNLHNGLKVFLTVWLAFLLGPLVFTVVVRFGPWALAGFSPASYDYSEMTYAGYRTALWLIPTSFLFILYYITRPGNIFNRYGS
jgi:hypothetical protein